MRIFESLTSNYQPSTTRNARMAVHHLDVSDWNNSKNQRMTRTSQRQRERLLSLSTHSFLFLTISLSLFFSLSLLLLSTSLTLIFFQPFNLVSIIYQYLQAIISFLFAPLPPSQKDSKLNLGHVAVIGAGVTGVSTAAHLVGHGFNVTIFDQSDSVGGIWSNVNKTSGLQISSLMYRFFPTVRFTRGYPKQAEIVDNIESVWKRYGLEEKTKFNVSGEDGEAVGTREDRRMQNLVLERSRTFS